MLILPADLYDAVPVKRHMLHSKAHRSTRRGIIASGKDGALGYALQQAGLASVLVSNDDKPRQLEVCQADGALQFPHCIMKPSNGPGLKLAEASGALTKW